MNDYNGFSGAQRTKAGAWIRAERAAGRLLPRPTECVACGQRVGSIDDHAEDYSEPFGLQTIGFPLCYICHMMLHCRYSGNGRWGLERYTQLLEMGGRQRAHGRDFRHLQAIINGPAGDDLEARVGGDPQILRDIVAGRYDPRHGTR